MSRAHFVLEALAKLPSDLNAYLADQVMAAQKFSFNPGDLSTDLLDDAIAYGIELVEQGVPLTPYPVVLYEFGPKGLFDQADFFEWVLFFEVDNEAGGKDRIFRTFVSSPGLISGVICGSLLGQVDGSDYKIIGADATQQAAVEAGMYAAVVSKDDPIGRIAERARALGISDENILSATPQIIDSRAADEVMAKMLDTGFSHSLAMLGLLNVRGGVETSLTPAPAFINKQRAKKGKSPIFAYHLLKISPANLRIPSKAVGTQASPAAHDRRGHLRRLRSGQIISVRPARVGDRKNGEVVKEYMVQITEPSSGD